MLQQNLVRPLFWKITTNIFRRRMKCTNIIRHPSYHQTPFTVTVVRCYSMLLRIIISNPKIAVCRTRNQHKFKSLMNHIQCQNPLVTFIAFNSSFRKSIIFLISHQVSAVPERLNHVFHVSARRPIFPRYPNKFL